MLRHLERAGTGAAVKEESALALKLDPSEVPGVPKPLVQSYLLAQDRMVQPDVYAGLSAEIMTLAGVLPGIHPFLRKYARRLASRLP